jgi:hypothetical protein
MELLAWPQYSYSTAEKAHGLERPWEEEIDGERQEDSRG